MIEIRLNGQPRSLKPGTLLPQLLEELGLKDLPLLVERNGQALLASEHAACRLQEGDRLELVRIVAGG
jgi:sulfur carrier protein